MRKAKNTLSILGIVFGVLAAAAFVLLPLLNGWIAKEGTLQDVNTFIPVMEMILPTKFVDFVHYPVNFAEIASFSGFTWFRLGLMAALCVFIILFIIWFIMILAKKKPGQLVLWLLVLIVAAACADVIMCGLIYPYGFSSPEVDTEPIRIAYVGLNETIGYPGLDTHWPLLLVSIFVLTNSNVEPNLNPVVKYSLVGAFALAALALVLILLAIFFNFGFLKSVKKAAVEEVEESAPVVSEEMPEESAVEAVPEEKVEEELPFKIVRKILVNRSGRVIRVLNEEYFDVTTNVYIDPGYNEPVGPIETEQQHFEKIIMASRKSYEHTVKVEPVKAAPAPAVAPAPVAPAPVEDEEEAKKVFERIPFETRIKSADKSLKKIYSDLKSEILAYGVKSRIAAGGDTFRLHTKTYVKMTVAGKSLKLYLALNPADYSGSTFPIGDASSKNLYKEIPLVFKVKSDLSVRRAKQLIADAMAVDKLEKGEVVAHDWVKEIK